MKRLIVLSALATLLGPSVGCSLLNKRNAPSCETCEASSSSSLLSGIRLPRISLPWRRSAELSGQCNSCNEGFTEVRPVGVGTGNYVQGPIDGTGFIDYGASTSNLYNRDVVYSGPTVIDSTPTTLPSASISGYAGELLPAPISPELGPSR